jgi:magnesium chelatase subunit D
MNAEEGELRPQLLDRFGLGVEVVAPVQPAERAEIVRRRLAYEADPVRFAERWADADADVAASIVVARDRLLAVRLPERELDRIVRACAEIGVDGMRGDVVTARTARVLAALEGVDEVDAEHVRRAAHLALAHRRRRDPLAGGAADPAEIDRALQPDPGEPPPPDGPPPPGGGAPPPGAASDGSDGSAPAPRGGEGPAPEAADLAAPAPRERLDAPDRAQALTLPPLGRRGAGATRAGRSARAHGLATAPIDSRRASGDDDDLALVATLRERLAGVDPAARRVNVRAGREGTLLCLVVDASGSMAARRRMARVKGALLGLLRDAYARRERVAIVAFRDARAHVVHVPGAPLEHAAAAVLALRTGGRTPLAAGLDAASELIRRDRARDPRGRAIAVVLTDGRAPAASAAAARLGRAADAVHVVDTEEGAVRLGLARELAVAAGGDLIALPAIRHPSPRRVA